MEPFQIVVLGTLAVAISATLVWVATRMKRTPEKQFMEAQAPAETPSTPPTVARTLTAREQRDADIRARWETGQCLYCERTATHARPRLRLVTSVFDALYRRLGVVPRDRHRIEVHAHSERDQTLCEDHHYLARARLEAKLSESAQCFALHVIDERDTLVRFERYELDEDMKAQAEATRRGRPGAEVRTLRSANGG